MPNTVVNEWSTIRAHRSKSSDDKTNVVVGDANFANLCIQLTDRNGFATLWTLNQIVQST